MKHAEVVIARQAIEEGRGLVVIVNKMDLLRGNSLLIGKVMEAIPKEIQTVIPQVCIFSHNMRHAGGTTSYVFFFSYFDGYEFNIFYILNQVVLLELRIYGAMKLKNF